jgi:hypothetical protein
MPLEQIYEVADKLLALRNEKVSHKTRLSEIDAETAELLLQARYLLTEAVTNGDLRIQQQEDRNGVVKYEPQPFPKHEPVPTPENLTKSTIRNQVIAYFRDRKGQQVLTEHICKALPLVKRQSIFWTLSHLRAEEVLEHPRRGVWRLKEGAIEALEESRGF